ncbi:MmcB family DNA repair protein [Marinobacter salarius]|uniref:MmcB family DNA repair protein n=1 Tax=Marinobacter salarius TaxID=1420917 RepID=UPI003D0EED74
MKHDELMIRLADYLSGISGRMMWTDMQLGPSGSPRPDVFAMDKSFMHPKPVAYEVKVSLSDFRSDVTKGKWQSYLEFSGAVIFVVPKGLITKNDVPNGCGLMTYNEEADTFASVKKPTLHPVTLPQRVMLKLLIDGADRVHQVNRRHLLDEYQIEKRVRKALGDEVAAAVFDIRKAEQRRDYELARIQGQIDSAKRRAEHLQEDMKRERARVDDFAAKAYADLYQILGIDPGQSLGAYQFQQRIRELREALCRDTAIVDLENQIDQIRKAISRPTPMEKLRAAGGGL